MLEEIWNDEEKFRQEFPAIYKDIEQKKRQQRNTVLRANADDLQTDTGWKDYEQIRMIYDPRKRKLRIQGRVHKTVRAFYSMFVMKVQNKQGIIKEYRYTVSSSTFLFVEEELAVGPRELDGICAEISYLFVPFFRRGISRLTGKITTERVEEAGIDIIGKGEILHPISKSGRNKIDIIYWRGGTADYCYSSSYDLKDEQGRFLIHLPIALHFELDQGFALSDRPDIDGKAFVYSKNHGVVAFDNWKEVKMIPASQWKKEGYIYPEISGALQSGCLLVLPQAWKRAIEKDGISGDDDFYLSLDVQFTCQDGERYSLQIESRETPRAYSGGAEVEIPCLHLLWGCIEKSAKIEVYGKGRIPVSEVLIGDKVLSGDNTYEKVCDVITGEEEILEYIRVNGQELKLTMDHPVMTREGFKPARALLEGEQILLQDGAFYPVQEIYDEPYYDKVYSLNLEHGEGFFANQIYVGDFKMQNAFKKEDEEIPQEILAELEKFRNSI